MTTAFIAPWIRRAIALARLGRARAALAATAFGLARHGTAWDVLPSAPSAYSVYLYWRRGVGTSTHCGRLSAELSLQSANLGACLLHSCVAGAPGRVLSRRRHCPASVSSEHECARQLAIAEAAASLAPTYASTAQAISPDRRPFPTTATKSGTVPAPRWSARQRPPAPPAPAADLARARSGSRGHHGDVRDPPHNSPKPAPRGRPRHSASCISKPSRNPVAGARLSTCRAG
jgi:hypothetical protein